MRLITVMSRTGRSCSRAITKEHEVEAYLAREVTDMDKAMVDHIHSLFEPLCCWWSRRPRAGLAFRFR